MGANNFVAFAGEASARLPKMDSAEGAIADEAIWIAESVALAQSVVHRDIPTDTHGTPVLLSSEYRISRGGAAGQATLCECQRTLGMQLRSQALK